MSDEIPVGATETAAKIESAKSLIERARNSFRQVGEGDWSPQDTYGTLLAADLEKFIGLVAAERVRAGQAERERDALVAVIEKVKATSDYSGTDDAEEMWAVVSAVDDVLDSVPSDVLADLKADVWDEGYGDDVYANTPRTNPYRRKES